MSNIRSRRVTKSTKCEDFEYNSELESELESDTDNHSMGREKPSDHQQTSKKEIATDATNPLLNTPTQRDKRTEKEKSPNTTPVRSAYKLAEEANRRISLLETHWSKIVDQITKHYNSIQSSIDKDLATKDSTIKEKDKKIENLRQELHNLQNNRQMLVEENEALKKALTSSKAKEGKADRPETDTETTGERKTHKSVQSQAPKTKPGNMIKLEHERVKTTSSDIFISGEGNILSMMYESKIQYKCVEYKTPEHAYQCAKVEHVLGKQDKLYEEVKAAATGKDAKTQAKQSPYSPTWQKQKVKELEQICRARANQDMNYRTSLEATGDQNLIHNVPNAFWGSGTSTAARPLKGKNIYGKTLEKIRREIQIDKDRENSPAHLVLRKNTDVLLLCDSVMRHVDLRRFRGRMQVHKQPVYNSDELQSVAEDLDRNNHIQEVIMHTGINDLRTKDTALIVQELQAGLKTIKEKLPNATITVSELVAAKHNRVESINKELEHMAKKEGYVFAPHYIRRELFSDDTHISPQGTAKLVSEIADAIDPQRRQRNSQPGNMGKRYSPQRNYRYRYNPHTNYSYGRQRQFWY